MLGCTPGTGSDPSVSPSASSLAPIPDSQLPATFTIDSGLLDGTNLPKVVARLQEATGGLPTLKLDVTPDSATLSVLLDNGQVDSLRWSEGQITRVDSDVQYLKQATFNPEDYPLDQAQRMFDVADLRGVRGEATLQIVEYRAGQVMTTITSRPETTTVFFRQDGTAIADLGLTSVADITAGLTEVTADSDGAYAVGFNPARGYWADLVDTEEGVVLSRNRLGGLPVFETRRNETLSKAVFDPKLIAAAPLAKAISRAQDNPSQQCDVVIDLALKRSAPVVKVDCEGQVSYTDLTGRDMTKLIG